MTRRVILTFALSTLALIPPACVIESSNDNNNGGESSTGGTTNQAGSGNLGGSSTGTTKTGTAGTTSLPTATGGTPATGGAAATGGATAVNSAGASTVGNAGTTAVAAAGTAGAISAGGAGGTASTTVPIVRTPVTVDTDITAATVWTADHVYIIEGSLYVTAALTIQPGTVVKFAANATMYVQSTGQLNAVGTSALPIVFTSIKDDSGGGDTNQDGSATQAGVGDWNRISILGNSSKLDYCTIQYSTSGVVIDAKSASIKNSTFALNTDGLDASSCDPTLVLTGNVFYDNVHPLYTDANIPVDATTTFHAPGNTSKVNKYQNIAVSGDITQATTWSNIEVAYALEGSTYVTSSVLTLASGVVLKFNANATLYVQTGSTLAGASSATFTSYKDDTKLGDSNGDAAASTPASGDWNGVRIADGDTWLSGANVLYAATH